jgi:hypothetical protein
MSSFLCTFGTDCGEGDMFQNRGASVLHSVLYSRASYFGS